MAVIGNTYLTLIDLYKRTDPDNRIAAIIELLAETNEILTDAIALEGNLVTGHRTTIRTGLPSGTWRLLNYGVQPTKSTTKQIDDQCGMLEDYSEVDKALADLNGNTAAFRLSESMAHLEGMNNDMADALFYGNTETDPEKFMGLAPRYDLISTDKTQSGYNIVDCGGVGSDNCSIWGITWGPNATHLIYPKGSKGGLMHEDLGEQTLTDAAGGLYQGYRDHYKWDIGLTVRDWRGTVRLANLDVSLMAAGSVAIDDFLIDAYYKFRKTPGKKAFYAPEEAMIALHKAAKDKTNVNLGLSEFAGKPIVSFLGIPIRQCDSILLTEARIV